MPPTPNRGGSYLTAPDTEEGGHSTPISPDLAIGGPSWPVGCKQRFKPGGSSGLDSQLLGTILGRFPTTFRFWGPALYLNI